MQRVYFILPLCTFSKNNECLFAPVQRRLKDAGRWKKFGGASSHEVGKIWPPGWNRVYWSVKNWGCQWYPCPPPPRSCDWFLAPLTFHLNFIKNKSTKKKKKKCLENWLKFCIKTEKIEAHQHNIIAFVEAICFCFSIRILQETFEENPWKLHNICFCDDYSEKRLRLQISDWKSRWFRP